MNDLDRLEKMMKSIRIKNIICKVSFYVECFCVGVILLVNYIFNDLFYNSNNYILGIFYAICLILFLVSLRLKKNLTEKVKYESAIFNNEFKSKFTINVFNEMFTNVIYNQNGGFQRIIIDSVFCKKISDMYNSSDYIIANYNNVNFEFSNIKAETKNSNDTGNIYKTIFCGQWYIFDFNKNFNGDIRIIQKHFLDNNIEDKSGLLRFKKIETENILFNELFDVYVENELESFYILTPQFIEKIVDFQRSVNCDLIFHFCNNKFHIGINSNRFLFEPNINKSIDLKVERDNIISSMKMIIEIIDVFDLDDSSFNNGSIL